MEAAYSSLALGNISFWFWWVFFVFCLFVCFLLGFVLVSFYLGVRVAHLLSFLGIFILCHVPIVAYFSG
jgi:hypothetical protein